MANSNSSGFRCVDQIRSSGGWIVTGLYQGSNAESSGLEIDDLILKVNGKDVKSLDFEKRWELFAVDAIELIVIRHGVRKSIEFPIEEYKL